VESNDEVGISIAQPRLLTERTAVAGQCCARLEMSMPLLVDAMNDRVGHLYSGMPDRLYLIDQSGRIAYKGGRGPFGFKTGELEQSLLMLLLDRETPTVASRHGIPVLSNAEAWTHLPPAPEGGNQPLPSWARALAGALPRTTARLLEIDYLQRTHPSLDATLRGKLRWVAAHANRCAWAEACATGDLRRAGVPEAEIRALAGDLDGLPAPERAALRFARQLTVAADEVTDDEVRQLVRYYGDPQVVAVVLLIAYANFQDRLILALGLPADVEAARAPLAVRFEHEAAPAAAPLRPTLPSDSAGTPFRHVADPEWLALNYPRLQEEMDLQRARPARIRVPSWEEVRKRLPPDYPANRPSRIRWSLVCLGYQPELGAAWLRGLRTFAEESQQDRVFEESVFWVITRTLHCFY
jgi:alkylhydroperoxidase family enzyme